MCAYFDALHYGERNIRYQVVRGSEKLLQDLENHMDKLPRRRRDGREVPFHLDSRLCADFGSVRAALDDTTSLYPHRYDARPRNHANDAAQKPDDSRREG